MKSFKYYLTEANYTRFFEKSPNLDKKQAKEINKFFNADNKAFDNWQDKYSINIQTNSFHGWTWADFIKFMLKYPYGRKQFLSSIKIPGTKGKDYWPMKTKSKGFIANIPLNRKTAQYMNSCEYGTINVNYCIGRYDKKVYWKEHIVKQQQVPVYVVDGNSKWVVMIQKNNSDFEVWDKFNSLDTRTRNKESIPGFSIKRDLIGSRQSKLYNDIRDEFYKDTHWIKFAEISNDADYEITFYDNIHWYYGTWLDGTWEDGKWYKGIWKKGTWEDGTWYKGIWEKGTWEKGTWAGGTWLGGTWLGGYDIYKDYHPAGDSPDKW